VGLTSSSRLACASAHILVDEPPARLTGQWLRVVATLVWQAVERAKVSFTCQDAAGSEVAVGIGLVTGVTLF
jgi:hypothetical protein